MAWEVSKVVHTNFSGKSANAAGLNSRARYPRNRPLIIAGGFFVLSVVVIGVLQVFLPKTEANNAPITLGPDTTVQSADIFGTVPLLAPTVDIKAGQRMGSIEGMLTEVSWPRDKVPGNAVRSLDEVRDMYAKMDLPAGSPILLSNLDVKPKLSIIDVPKGYRAVTIQCDAESCLEGWAQPGAHVDVVVIHKDRADGLVKATVVVEDAVVLSFGGDQRVNRESVNGGVANVPTRATVTLSALQEDALKIQAATAMGTIRLQLRSMDEEIGGGQTTFSEDQLIGKKKPKHESLSMGQGQGTATPGGFARFADMNGKEKSFEFNENGGWTRSEDDY